MTEQRNAAVVCIVEAADQVDQRRFAAARTADDADGLTGPGRERDVRQARCTGILVGEGDVLKLSRLGSVVHSQLCRAGILHRRVGVQNLIDAHAAGQCAGDRNDQIRQTQQAQQNLAHIVDKGNDLALRQLTGIDLYTAAQQQRHNSQVDDEIGQRVHQRRNTACRKLQLFQVVICLHKGGQLVRLAGKGTHHARADVVFARQQRHTVQAVLGLMVDGHGHAHDGPYNKRHHNRNADEKQRQLRTDGERHNKRADHDERRAQQQTQRQVDAVLYLVDVARHAGDKRRGADAVQLAVAQRANMAEQVLAQCRAKAQRRLCGEPLCRQAAGQADSSQQDQQAAARPDEGCILIFDARVDDAGNDQRHKQFKTGFQHLEKRR